MKRLKTSDITTTVGFPIKSGTLDFLQDSYSELLASLAMAMIGPDYDPTLIYQVSGQDTDVADLGGGSNQFIMYDGYYLYNREIFHAEFKNTAWQTGPTFGIEVFIEVQNQVAANADPVTFSDASNKNVHEIRRLRATNTAGVVSGAGTSVYFSTTAAPTIRRIGTGEKMNGVTSDIVYYGTYTADATRPISLRVDGRRLYMTGRSSNSASAITSTDQDIFLIMDPRYRPAVDQYFISANLNNPSINRYSIIKVASTGVVTLMGTMNPSDNAGIYFNQIAYEIF